MIILGKSDDIALGRDLQAAASADLDIGAFELSDEGPVPLEHGHVEAISMTVAYEDVPRIADVDSVRVVGDVLAANST